MTPEQHDDEVPQWAAEQREHDLSWVGDNLHVFWPRALALYHQQGRGVLIVDTTLQPVPNRGHPFAYFPQEIVETGDDEGVKRLLREYEPEREFVVMLLKAEDRVSSYRVCPQPRPSTGQSSLLSLS